MATLYRQYRPATFHEVMGQTHVTETLQAAIKKNKLTHAYLFHGPRGTGKTSTARILARRINCQKPKGTEPCGKCASCLAAIAGNHIDIIEIDAASNRGIDDIRALRERISSAPSLGSYKVYIIDEVHMLTQEASTALLKTLEEPVKHVIFILATTELHKVIPTILSRCQVYRFRRASKEELTERLNYLLKKEKRKADPAVLDFIIERSDGCYRDAESLLGQLLTIQQDQLKLDALINFLGLPPGELISQFLNALSAGNSAPAIAAVDNILSSGHDPEQFLQECIFKARDLAVEAAIKGEQGAGRWPTIIRALLQAMQDLSYVPQPAIALHLAILTVCTTPGTAPIAPASAPTSAIKEKIISNADALATPSSPATKATKEPGAFSVSEVSVVWPKLIESVKGMNPVASTFLRAIEPMSVSGQNITIRTRYSLHRNFFENQKNKVIVSEALSKLLNQPVTVSFILDDNGQAKIPSLINQRKEQEDNFYNKVKEVFGS